MALEPRTPSPPPWLLRLLAQLLIRGRHASFILPDLDASFTRDLERGFGWLRATGRYASNIVASVWSIWTSGALAVVTSGIGLDVRLGLRMLARQRLVTVVAGLTLALGIPASLTIVHGFEVLYGDLPIEDADRVVGMRHYDVTTQRPMVSTLHDYEAWTELASYDAVGAVRSYRVNATSDGAGGAPVLAAEVTASSFDILRAGALRGRVIQAGDARPGAPDVALIGEDLWGDRFSRDPDIVGRTLRLGRTSHTIIGVMPVDFGFPLAHQVWLPLRSRARDFMVGEGPGVFVFGRLADGVTIDEARVELEAVGERRAGDDPQRFDRLAAEIVGMPALVMNHHINSWTDPDVIVMQVLIFGLLIVVCGNVGTLFLARTTARTSELTIRTALGASRARILVQLFVEALVLSVAATGIGLLAANAFAKHMGRLVAAFDDTLSYWWVDLSLTPRITMIALGLAALCAGVIGVLPALSTTRAAVQTNLQNTSQRGSSVRFGIGPSLLIVAEIALSVGFLALGATAVRSAFGQEEGDLGFDPDRYVVGTFRMPELDPATAPGAADSAAWSLRVVDAQRTLLAELSEDPSVVGVAMGLHVPGVKPGNRGVLLETPPGRFEPIDRDILIPRVDVSFFAGLNRAVIAGRDFGPGDVDGPTHRHRTAVIVNESFVRDVLGNRSALGQRLRYEPQFTAWPRLDEGEWFEIVGVVESFGTNPENRAQDAAIYHPLAPGEANPVRFAMEVVGDAEAFVPRLRQIAASVDPEATMDPSPLSAVLLTESRVRRVAFMAMLLIASLTFFLSATGLYALMSFTVSQRTREIGIRASLGADTVDIVSAVARRAAVQIGVGLALGVALGWVLVSDGSWGFDLGNLPLTLALTAAVAGGICTAACARPTLRGIRVAPTEALRES